MKKGMIILKNHSRRFVSLALLLVLLCALLSVSASALEVHVNDIYSTGEVVLIEIKSPEAVNVADYTMEITKPNGEVVTTAPRQEKWNDATECFETYTIEMLGDYEIQVSDTNGDSGSASFSARIFSTDSIIFTIVSVVIFAASIVAYVISKRKNAGKGV